MHLGVYVVRCLNKIKKSFSLKKMNPVLISFLFSLCIQFSSAQNRAYGAIPCSSAPLKSSSLPSWPSGTKVRVECPEGYAFVAEYTGDNDDRTTTCAAYGQWNKRLGSCKRVGPLCDKPTDPLRGSIDQMSAPIDESPNQFTPGSFITYKCDPGYYLTGDSTIRCQSTGRWDRATPRCECKQGFVAKLVSNTIRHYFR